MTILPHFQNLTISGVFGVFRSLFLLSKNEMFLQFKNTRLAIMGFVLVCFRKFEV